MQSGIKLIFKTLFKVPIIICTFFLILNVFSYVFTSIRLLSIYYVAVNTAVANNYIPTKERNSLEAYLGQLETSLFTDVKLTPNTISQNRVQYGEEVTVGVQGQFHIVWPLMPHEQTGTGTAVTGLNPAASVGELSEAELDNLRQEKDNFGMGWTIKFEDKVPGMHYYADLDLD